MSELADGDMTRVEQIQGLLIALYAGIEDGDRGVLESNAIQESWAAVAACDPMDVGGAALALMRRLMLEAVADPKVAADPKVLLQRVAQALVRDAGWQL